MKVCILYLTICFLTITIFAQKDTLFPSNIYKFPDIHPDSLYSFIEQSALYDSIQQENTKYDSLSQNEQKLLEKAALFERGPFYTGAYGCSWYCVNNITSIKSNSFIKAHKAENFLPENCYDFDLRTAWISNLSDNKLSEISFKMEVAQDTQQLNIIIYNGFSKSKETWKRYNRAKKIKLSINNTKSYILCLQDVYYGQVFKLPFQQIGIQNETFIKLKVLEYYDKKKKPIALSEINFEGTAIH